MKYKVFFTIVLFALNLPTRSFAQQAETTGSQAVDKTAQIKKRNNAVYLSFGSVASSKTRDFSPVLDVYYVRTLLKGFGIGVGYSFYDYDMKLFPKEESVLQYKPDVHAHTLFFELDYSFHILSSFTLVPWGRIGYAFQQLQSMSQGDIHLLYEPNGYKQNGIAGSIGMLFSYDFSSLSVFVSYGYFMSDFEFDTPRLTADYDPNCILKLNHHELKLGIGYKF